MSYMMPYYFNNGRLINDMSLYPFIRCEPKRFIDRIFSDIAPIHEEDDGCDDNSLCHVYNLGIEADPHDIEITLSENNKKLTVKATVNKNNGCVYHIKKTTISPREIDKETMKAELVDGQLIVNADYIVLEEKPHEQEEITPNKVKEIPINFVNENESSSEEKEVD